MPRQIFFSTPNEDDKNNGQPDVESDKNKKDNENIEIPKKNKPKEIILEEAPSIEETLDSKWWLISGAKIFLDGNGSIKTIQGELPDSSKWRLLYAMTNPTDTDDGYRPQNILRLTATSEWQNFQQEVYFKINNYNLSNSPNRNESNGVLLFNRYENQNNLYYTGIRVDGYAVVKKKSAGIYYMMDYKPIFINDFTPEYDREENPNLLPKNKWIGLRSVVKNTDDGNVNIKLFMDINNNGKWILVSETEDDGIHFGKAVMDDPSRVGIRTDFMDVEFKGYKIKKIE